VIAAYTLKVANKSFRLRLTRLFYNLLTFYRQRTFLTTKMLHIRNRLFKMSLMKSTCLSFSALTASLLLFSVAGVDANPSHRLNPVPDTFEDQTTEDSVTSSTGKGGSPVPSPKLWPKTSKRVDYDFARASSGGKVAYVGSGSVETAYKIVDGDIKTFFNFDKAGEDALFIVSLAETYPVYQASIATDEAIQKVEIWTLSSYPSKLFRDQNATDEDTAKLVIPSEYLASRATAGRIDVPADQDVNFLTIPLPDTTARYLLVRVVAKNPINTVKVGTFSVVGRVPTDYLGPAFVSPPTSEPPEVDPPITPWASE